MHTTSVNRVLLVNAGTDEDVSSIANDGTFPALGVVSLATALLRHRPPLEVVAIDGQVTPMAEIQRLVCDFEPDVLGISVLGTSYRNTLQIAELGKNAGACTILGNDHAASMAKRILAHREAVDYVCTADVGEFALCAFIDALDGKRPIESVPQLVYRVPDGIVHNEVFSATFTRVACARIASGQGLRVRWGLSRWGLR